MYSIKCFRWRPVVILFFLVDLGPCNVCVQWAQRCTTPPHTKRVRERHGKCLPNCQRANSVFLAHVYLSCVCGERFRGLA